MTPSVLTRHETRREAYRVWLRAQGLRFGFADELANCANGVHNLVKNDTPPDDKWAAMLPTVRILERIREQFGATTITSGYRSLLYNATYVGQGAVKDSMHTKNIAIDFVCGKGTPTEWASYARFLRDEGAFLGGVGVYRAWVHIDTRGYDADWDA